MHPFFKLLVDRPAALSDHVEAYASLATLELSAAVMQLRQRAVKTAVAVVGASVAVLLGGVSAMLWAVTPAADLHAPWVLWLTPVLPAALAIGCWWSARAVSPLPAFSALRGQVREDIAMLREVAP